MADSDTNSADAEQEGDGQADNHQANPAVGARRKPCGSAEGDAYIGVSADGSPDLRVSGYWLDDEPGGVEISATVGAADVTLGLDPDAAAEFAQQILVATRFAEGETDV